jgi:tripartite-type tricarboxylate transporter receptor subunit TctC
MKRFGFGVAIAGMAGLVLASTNHAAAQTAPASDEFYRGKNLSIIIGYSVGGGYDIYARMLARHMGKHIPGRPTLVPQNMPGAGSLKSLEYLLRVAPKDGLTVGTFGRTLPLSPLLEDAKYDATALEWVGSITSDTSTCLAWHTTGIKSLKDLETKKFTGGGLGKGSDPDIFTSVLRNLFGLTNVRLVSGYPGTKDLVIALERGEIDGICGYTYSTIRTSHKAWLDDKKLVFMAQIGVSRDPELADVPLLSELGRTPQERQALELISVSQQIARPFAMPPGTDKGRVETLRKAFDATMKDADFLAEAKAARLEVKPFSGAQIAELIAKAYATPKEIVAEARRAIGN